MSLNSIEIEKFRKGFNQFTAEEIRDLFGYVKALKYNSSAAAPLQLDTERGFQLSLDESLGTLVKAKAVIADGAVGKVVRTDLLFVEQGIEIDAKNFTGSATTNGQTKLMLGRIPDGSFFFRKTEAGAGGSQGNFWVEFTDTDSHKFWVEGTMAANAKDILIISMTGGGAVSMDGGGAASGLVTLQLGLDQAGDRTWELETPDGTAFGQMYDDIFPASLTPLTSIAIGSHTWSMISILVQENIPPGTALPAAW